MNATLREGDCLDVMRSMDSESIDLIYLDPPFNTGKDRYQAGKSFDDNWEDDRDYLQFMAERLRDMRRLLKPTGSIYLHCDPTMSHYLKVEMDGIFGKDNFCNEVVWCYPPSGIAPEEHLPPSARRSLVLCHEQWRSHIQPTLWPDVIGDQKKIQQSG